LTRYLQFADFPEPDNDFCCAVAAYNLGLRVGADDKDILDDIKGGFFRCFRRGLVPCVKGAIRQVDVDKLDITMPGIVRGVSRFVAEKINLRKMARDIWKLAKKHGWKMAVIAILLEIFEDIVLPGLAIVLGHPEFAPAFLALHLEPIVYPIALCMLS